MTIDFSCDNDINLSLASPVRMVPSMDPSLLKESVGDVEVIQRAKLCETNASVILHTYYFLPPHIALSGFIHNPQQKE